MKRSSTLQLGIFVLRNSLLYFLFLHAYLYFKTDLDLVFLSAGFLISVLLALLADRTALRLWAAALLFMALLLLLRSLFFLVFRLQAALSPGPHTDFLFFRFDRDFFPGLLPWAVVWLFNFLALRYPAFIRWEAGFDALLLVAVFWPQGHYRISLYRHPSLLAYSIFGFLLLSIVLLVLTRVRETDRLGGLRSAASFLWVFVPLFLIVFLFVLGRYSQGAIQQGSGLMKPTLFRFDFSQFIRLESEISVSDDLVLLFRKQGPAQRILLRRFILSGYDEKRGFHHISSGHRGWQDLPLTVSDQAERFADPGFLARREVTQEYYFVNFDPSSLIGMNHPVRVAPLTNWDSSSFLRIYRVDSLVSHAGLEELAAGRAAGPASAGGGDGQEFRLSPQELEVYTEYGGDVRLREFARQVTESSGEEAPDREERLERVLRIQSYLKDNYYYSLMPGMAADGDQLSHFLYDSRKGYCSYFAFAMTLMCRSLGIPARVAVGFFVDPETEVLNFYEVRAHQAHAWVEVFFEEYGWIEFDPTSEVIAPGEEDTIRYTFDFQSFARLLEEILRNQHQLREREPQTVEVQSTVRLLGGELVRGLKFVARLWYFFLPALYLSVIALLKFLPLLRARGAFRARSRIKLLFAATRLRLEDHGLKRHGEESLLEYAHRIEGRHALRLHPWVESYLQAVFDDTFEPGDLERALIRHRRFSHSLKRCFPPFRRLLAFLNPLNLFGRLSP